MDLSIICTDILTRILYDYDLSLTTARLVCSKWKKVVDTYGFIETITFGINTPFITFINMNTMNLLSLKTLTMDSITDAALWIPCKWPHTTIFRNCSMGHEYINPPISKTHILRVSDHTSTTPLRINWKKLLELREIYLDVFDCTLNDLQYCTKLEVICINNRTNTNTFPPWVGLFPNLRTIMTNIKTVMTIHFVSPMLQVCLVPKITPFTAVSKLVPKKHLVDNMYISIHNIPMVIF